MAPHATETAEKYPRDDSVEERADDQDSGQDSGAGRKGEMDESKFSSLTSALLVRKRPVSISASSAMTGDVRKGQSGQLRPTVSGAEYLARKGEAAPSNPMPQASTSIASEALEEEL